MSHIFYLLAIFNQLQTVADALINVVRLYGIEAPLDGCFLVEWFLCNECPKFVLLEQPLDLGEDCLNWLEVRHVRNVPYPLYLQFSHASGRFRLPVDSEVIHEDDQASSLVLLSKNLEVLYEQFMIDCSIIEFCMLKARAF